MTRSINWLPKKFRTPPPISSEHFHEYLEFPIRLGLFNRTSQWTISVHRRKKVILLASVYLYNYMSSAAHRFGRVEFWIFVLIFFHWAVSLASCACLHKTNNKYSIFKFNTSNSMSCRGHYLTKSFLCSLRKYERIILCLIMSILCKNCQIW